MSAKFPATVDSQLLAGYFTEQELASELRISIKTLVRWRDRRRGPAPTIIGRKILYAKATVTDWLVSSECTAKPAKKNARRTR